MCHNLTWVDIWEPGGETQQRLRREAVSKPGHGTYYWCLHGLHIRGNSNHWLQLDATATPLPMPEVHAGPSFLYLQPIVLQEQQPYYRTTRASDPKMLLSRGGPTIGGACRDSASEAVYISSSAQANRSMMHHMLSAIHWHFLLQHCSLLGRPSWCKSGEAHT